MDSHPMKLEWWPALRAAADAGRRAVPVGAADGGRRPAACAVAVKEHSAAASMESGSRRWRAGIAGMGRWDYGLREQGG